MYYQSLDGISRSYLAQKNLPIHYYLKTLKLATDCFRELHYDVLQVVNTRKLEVTDWNAVVLPEDFIDVISLSVRIGDQLLPLRQAKLHRLNNFDQTTGDMIPWDVATEGFTDVPRETLDNENQEFTGQIYAGIKDDGDYILLPERGEIQLRGNSGIEEVILEYLGDLNYTDAATKVDPYAQAAIEAYVAWKSLKDRSDNHLCAEARNYQNEVRKLRGRKNPLTAEDIKRAWRNGSKPTIK
jgi:hypothetical protein